MYSVFSTIKNYACSALPQNVHAHNVSKIETELQELQGALDDNKLNKTNSIFQKKIAEKKEELSAEKKRCSEALVRLNGSFYQDPASSLKKAWDTVVANVYAALSIQVEFRHELDNISNELDTKSETETIKSAKSSIEIYKKLEEKRDRSEARLHEIIGIERSEVVPIPISDPVLINKQNTLLARQKKLSGNYYQDPSCLLDQKWKEYQTAASANHSDAADILDAYNLLENERKSIDAELSVIQKQLLIPVATVEKSYAALTTQSIESQITALTSLKNDEAELAGVDWNQTAKAGAIALGYIATKQVGL